VRELDPDAHYGRGDGWDSNEDEEDDMDSRPVKALVAEAVRRATQGDSNAPDIGATGTSTSLNLGTPPPDSAGPEESKERLEWQSMLASVLGGDILRGESSRIGVEVPSNNRAMIAENLWWQIRARLRNRTEEEERRRVEQRRNRTVDSVLDEIAKFSVKTESEISPMDQVAYILRKLDAVESLYPNQRAFRNEKPLYNSERFQLRADALSAWHSVVNQLQTQLSILQKWTGTEDLDITRPNTTKEKALVGKNRFHPLDAKALAHAQNDVADDSTFVDRILKEDSLRRTFEKRIFMDQLATLQSAKQTLIAHSPLFAELNLPPFQYELLRIISFPGRLIIEALKTRLRAAERLVNPDPMVIDDMADSFRNSISLAIATRRQYEEIAAHDPDMRWNIPDSFPESYREVILKCIKMHLKLLHWKLKRSSKATDTEVLENEWGFLYNAAEAVEGVDQVVAQTLCSLTIKLVGRATNSFDSQLHLPIPIDAARPQHLQIKDNGQPEQQPMTTDQMVTWYSKILDAIKMRYRKLQRFSRRLTHRFENSAEYLLPDDMEGLLKTLESSGHFLVYSGVFEEQGTYIFADHALWGRENDVQRLLCRAFAVNTGHFHHERDLGEELDDQDSGEEQDIKGSYILMLSPRSAFAWTGEVMTLDDLGDAKSLDFGLEDARIRLVADGPRSRLESCKSLFLSWFVDPETVTALAQPECIIQQQAHLPKVNKEMKRITRAVQRLSECIVESAPHVSRTLRGAPGTQDLIENWYLFASDRGHRTSTIMEKQSAPANDQQFWIRFRRLLMRLAISWVSFICDHCDPTDRKTFRWTVNALEYAMLVTRGNNILHLSKEEFSLLRAKVANCMTLLISHFDILGARSSIEAKKEAERLEALRHLAQLYEQQNDEDDWLLPKAPPPSSQPKMLAAADRSLRLCNEERLGLIQRLEEQLVDLSTDQHLIGRVLDEEVSEDRALVFLAASSSNISLRWQQGGFIGGGANGSVYLGFNLDSGGIMAVKEIRVQDITNSPALYKQIKDEADVSGE
jgi:mitogen-activated protein kinase kinase kinase